MQLVIAVAVTATVAALLLALHLRRYRRHWHFAAFNREFHKRANYDQAAHPWLLAFEITSFTAWLAWITAFALGR
jgi:hypothetical protein